MSITRSWGVADLRRLEPGRLAGHAVFAMLLAVALVAALNTDGFFTAANLRSILSQSAYVGVFAVATALIMVSGNLFSLSLGTTGAVTASSALALLDSGPAVAIIVPLRLDVAIFSVQGFLIGEFDANPIIVTIAAGGLQQGVFLWASKGATITPPPGDTSFAFLTERIDTPLIGELPVAVYVLFAIVIVLELVMRLTRFGPMLRLVGENRPAARAAGLPVSLIVLGAFVIAGLCIGIVGVELAAFSGSGSLLVESTFTYDAIVAAVVGGIAITGGRGAIWQALAGTILIQAISTILLLRGYSPGWQILLKGLIVFGAVVLVYLNRARADR